MFHDEQYELLEELHRTAAEEGVSLYLVGGIVRDLFLGVPLHDKDIDVVVDGDGNVFAERAAKAVQAEVKKFPAFLTAKIIAPRKFPAVAEVDIAQPRTETYASPGALPQVSSAALKDDLGRRDFSINAIALPLEALREWSETEAPITALEGKAIDLFSGIKDLRARVLRVLHNRSFIDDPTRLYRGCRYLARLGGTFDCVTAQLAQSAVEGGALRTISGFRIFREVRYAFEEDSAALAMLEAMARHKLLVGPIFDSEANQAKYLQAAADDISKSASARGLLALMFAHSRGGDLDAAEKLFRGFGFGKKELQNLAGRR
jgi:tRNA nucleotidyltransferase (CCA-adding enzyme)